MFKVANLFIIFLLMIIANVATAYEKDCEQRMFDFELNVCTPIPEPQCRDPMIYYEFYGCALSMMESHDPYLPEHNRPVLKTYMESVRRCVNVSLYSPPEQQCDSFKTCTKGPALVLEQNYKCPE